MVFGSSAPRRINHAPTFSGNMLKQLFCCFTPYNSSMVSSRTSTMERRGTILMQRYELGRILGYGTFAKVYQARNILTGKTVAIKIIDKEKILRVGLIDQTKREIEVMRLVRHPNVVELYEVMATKSKIYFVMEYVRGGELFNKVAKGRLREDVSRKYFQQLVSAIDFCHSRGVYHRDLKPENLLLDENGNLKVSDFGLSALVESRRHDGLLHTTCGTPAYVAPEVINKRGYDGAKADIWSCGVVLFVLMAGYLPFNDGNLIDMYQKISKGEFKSPKWFPDDVTKLLVRVLDPNPDTRMSISEIIDYPWFRKGFKPIENQLRLSERGSLGDLSASFSSDSSSQGSLSTSSSSSSLSSMSSSSSVKLPSLNAFDIISRSAGFDLAALFEKEKRQLVEARFTTKESTEAVISKLEEVAQNENFKVEKRDGTVKLEGSKEGRKGLLAVEAEIFEIVPTLLVVEVKKTAGDTLEYQKFYHQDLRPSLKDIVWKWQVDDQSPPRTKLPPLPPEKCY